jgi:aminomethyltransferase
MISNNPKIPRIPVFTFMNKTQLYRIHLQSGAKMVPFAGFIMPVEYTGINNEHLAVRNAAGIFDVSHMGEFWVKGPDAYHFLQSITTNDISNLAIGQVQYSCLPNGKGGIVDDLLVYRYQKEKFMVVVNASNIQKDWDWFQKNNNCGADLENASDRISLLAVQGPKAMSILQRLTTVELTKVPYYTFVTAPLAGIEEVIISNTGYTGAGGFELYVNNEDVEKLWLAVMETGKTEGLIPAGLGARDTLRLEMGFCLYGNDIDDTTSPIEAGLGWITKFTDGNEFINREMFLKQKVEGVARVLKAFVLEERGIPRKDYEIVDANGDVIGRVTSGTMSPVLKQGIGMGYIDHKHASTGSAVYIRIRNKELKANIIKTPFIH